MSDSLQQLLTCTKAAYGCTKKINQSRSVFDNAVITSFLSLFQVHFRNLNLCH